MPKEVFIQPRNDNGIRLSLGIDWLQSAFQVLSESGIIAQMWLE